MIDESRYLQQLEHLQAQNWPEGAPREPQYPHGQRPLSDYLAAWAEQQPEKPALHFYGFEMSYAELDRKSNQFAQLLRDNGVQAGDPVAVFMPNCPQFHIVYFGIMKAAAIHVPVSPLSRELELRHQLGDSRPAALVCFDALHELAHPVCEELGIGTQITTSIAEIPVDGKTFSLPEVCTAEKLAVPEGVIDLLPALEQMPATAPETGPALDDVAALNYTGGTTGLPKGCVHSHRNIIDTVAAFYPIAFELPAEGATAEVILNFLPEFWIAGENTGMLFPMYSGATLVVMARWDARAFMELVQHYKVNQCALLVDSIDELLDSPDLASYDLSSLNTTPCISFIKKLNRDYRERWRKLTGATLFETAYGMTETHTCDTFTRGFQDNDFDLTFDPAFVGLPVPGTQFKICDFKTGELQPLGHEGEILLKTPTLLKGYWNKPDANAELFVDGWFRTGDLGMITEQGFIRYLGRRKEMLKVNGMSVFPTELESMLGQHSEIAACGVVGRADERKGQVPVAFIILKAGSEQTEQTLREWCRENMAVFKVPEIRLVQSMPMTATGKIIKNELEQLL